MIRSITLTDAIRDSANTGKYEVLVKALHEEKPDLKIPDTFMVIIKCESSGPVAMHIAWGFCDTQAEAAEFSQTLLATCELHYDKLKDAQRDGGAGDGDAHNNK